MSEQLRQHAWSVGEAAEVYERSRPDYPTAAVQWVLSGARRDVHRVLDLGAGTGKLTRTLVAMGLEVWWACRPIQARRPRTSARPSPPQRRAC